jgi:putative cardiolipin synthase
MSQTSGLRLLSVPREALAARLAVVRAARETLDLQYYIWHRDSSGLGLLDAVCGGGPRCVCVCCSTTTAFVDSIVLAVIDAHPRIDVRLFNPFPHRHHRWLDLLLHFTQVNRRMHNKSLTADRSVTIVGGRNVGDEYSARIRRSTLPILMRSPLVRRPREWLRCSSNSGTVPWRCHSRHAILRRRPMMWTP